jgi:hypothetical protein
MTATQDTPTTRHDEVQLLLRDLARVSGALSEIATVWRRAKPYLPRLPLILPLQLQETARQLDADIQALAGEGPGQSPGRARSAAHRFSVLKQGMACARAMTSGPGVPELGDGRLWESLSIFLHRAEAELTDLMLTPSALSRPGTSRSDRRWRSLIPG